MTAEDLANHRVDWVELLSRDFAGGSVQRLPPNGQGIATCFVALRILEQCGIERHHPDSVQSLHLSIEAMKLALADLDRYVADEEHMEFAAKALLTDEYLASRAALLTTIRRQISPTVRRRKAGRFAFPRPIRAV